MPGCLQVPYLPARVRGHPLSNPSPVRPESAGSVLHHLCTVPQGGVPHAARGTGCRLLGVVGPAVHPGPAPTTRWAWLWHAQYTHLNRSTQSSVQQLVDVLVGTWVPACMRQQELPLAGRTCSDQRWAQHVNDIVAAMVSGGEVEAAAGNGARG